MACDLLVELILEHANTNIFSSRSKDFFSISLKTKAGQFVLDLFYKNQSINTSNCGKKISGERGNGAALLFYYFPTEQLSRQQNLARI